MDITNISSNPPSTESVLTLNEKMIDWFKTFCYEKFHK